MSELKDHLFFLLADNIAYNSACNVFGRKEPFETEKYGLAKEVTGQLEIDLSTDEDFFIDVLIGTDMSFLIYGACFALTAAGTRNALPALLIKLEAANHATLNEIGFAIDSIKKRAGITAEQFDVLRDPAFRQISWNKSPMTFFCLFCVLCQSLDLDVEAPETVKLGAFLIAELAVDMGGFDTIDAFRICHMGSNEYFNEMRRFDKTMRSELLLSNELKDTDIVESQENKLEVLYQELMNEFLNIRLIQTFGQHNFGH